MRDRRRFASGGLAALLLACAAAAIEAPQRQATPPAPSDQGAFYATLQRSAHARIVRGLQIPRDMVETLAQGAADSAVAALSRLAERGDRDANIALVRVQHWCSRVYASRAADPEARIEKLSPALSVERAAKAAGVIRAEVEYASRAKESCGKARFDFDAIESRLRDAADAGHPASALELAHFVRDAGKRAALLQAAVAKQYPPALYAAATNLVTAVQRGETTENVESIRLWLKQAGASMPGAKLDLANCMSLGCDGHPADAAGARMFGLDAARDGEPGAFLSMVRMPWGARLNRVGLLAWQYFGDRLNEAGCAGEAYIRSAMQFAETIAALENGQNANTLQAARTHADELWREHGARAMQEQGCE